MRLDRFSLALVLFLPALLVAAAACDDDTGGGPPPSVAAEDLAAELAQAMCTAMFRCCTAEERDSAGFAGANDEATCASAYEGLLPSLGAPLDEAITANRATYDEAAAGVCVRAVRTVDCSEITEGVTDPIDLARDDCAGAIVPQQDADEECDEDYECASGVCIGAGGALRGMCADLPAVGQTCSLSCMEGARCDAELAKCIALKTHGEACETDEECKTGICNEATQICAGATPACAGSPNQGTADLSDAVAAVAEMACGSIFDCCSTEEREAMFRAPNVTESDCVTGASGELSELREDWETSVNSGRAELQESALERCLSALSGIACDATASFGMIDELDKLGDPSSAIDACRDIFDPGVGLGGACAEHWECETRYCADDGRSAICATLPGDGDPCGDECGPGLYCGWNTETCEALKATGEECESGWECESDGCSESSYVCEAPGSMCAQ